jgi:membrane-bound ClpP family serine protease
MTIVGLIYIGLLLGGVVYAVLAGLLGFLSDLGGADVHLDASGHFDAGNLHPLSGPIVASFVTGFGAGGTVGHYLMRWPLPGSVSLATVAGALLAGAAFTVMNAIFKHTQGGSEFRLEEIVGREAEVITPIPAGGTGEVTYLAKGQREVGAARSTDGSPIPRGKLVVVEKAAGPTLYVRVRPTGSGGGSA